MKEDIEIIRELESEFPRGPHSVIENVGEISPLMGYFIIMRPIPSRDVFDEVSNLDLSKKRGEKIDLKLYEEYYILKEKFIEDIVPRWKKFRLRLWWRSFSYQTILLSVWTFLMYFFVLWVQSVLEKDIVKQSTKDIDVIYLESTAKIASFLVFSAFLLAVFYFVNGILMMKKRENLIGKITV